MTEAEVSKKKKKTVEDSTEKELSLDELREKLARKELEEKLKEKHVDTSLVGVCQTCHIPIYHGEPVYYPHDYQSKGEHSGEYGRLLMVPDLLTLALLIQVEDTKGETNGIQFPKDEYNADDVISSIIKNWKVLRFESEGGIFEVLV